MDIPKRKPIRLKNFDYSQDGVYFITICSEDRETIFSCINKNQDLESAKTTLSKIGEICEKHLLDLENRFLFLKIISYVIMPDHIHALLWIVNENNHQEKLSDIIRTFKSLATKECRENFNVGKIFQRSYYDHIIRNEKDFENTIKYIESNPAKWIFDKCNMEKL